MTIYYVARIKNGETQQTFDFLELDNKFFSPYKPVSFFRSSELSDYIFNIKNGKDYTASITKKLKNTTLHCYVAASEKSGEGIVIITNETLNKEQVQTMANQENDIFSYLSFDANMIELQHLQFSYQKILVNSGVFMFQTGLAVIASAAVTQALFAISLPSIFAYMAVSLLMAGMLCDSLGKSMGKDNNEWEHVYASSFQSLSSI